MFAICGLEFAKGRKRNVGKLYKNNFCNNQKYHKRLQNSNTLLIQSLMLGLTFNLTKFCDKNMN